MTVVNLMDALRRSVQTGRPRPLVGVVAALVGVVALALVGVVNTAVDTCRFESRAGLVPPFFTHCAVDLSFRSPLFMWRRAARRARRGSASGPIVWSLRFLRSPRAISSCVSISQPPAPCPIQIGS